MQDLRVQGWGDHGVSIALLHSVLETHPTCARPVLPGVSRYVPREILEHAECNELDEFSPSVGCHVNGQMVTADRSVTTTEDPCVTCRCNAARLICAKQACPVLHCPSSRIVHDPGECCPRCKGTPILFSTSSHDFNHTQNWDTCLLRVKVFYCVLIDFPNSLLSYFSPQFTFSSN